MSHRPRIVLAACAVAALLLPAPGLAERSHRSLFYQDTPFGSLAWIKNATSREDASGKLFVDDLLNEYCVALPAAGAQWFIINHRDADQQGEVGYFAVRIVYDFGPGDTSPNRRTGIHLHRNGNWFDDAGRRSKRGYERTSERIALDVTAFTTLHDPSDTDEARRRADIIKAIGPWHQRLTINDDSTWNDRALLGPSLRAYLKSDQGAISARLIRFTTIGSDASSSPVLFWLDPRGATSATILISAPRQADVAARNVYTLRFGKGCDEN